MDRPSKRTVYLDHAATTPVDPRVVEAMLPFWTERYGNCLLYTSDAADE